MSFGERGAATGLITPSPRLRSLSGACPFSTAPAFNGPMLQTRALTHTPVQGPDMAPVENRIRPLLCASHVRSTR
jgi:hypothetical protein